MVTEIKEINADESPLLQTAKLSDISKEELVRDRIAKYTKTFDLLDSLGADNCVDPEDFDAEDMDDELFRNLQIADIEELFSTSQKGGYSSKKSSTGGVTPFSYTPHGPAGDISRSPRDYDGKFTSRSGGSRSDDNEPLLLEERTDSDYMKLDDGDDDLQFMDIDEQIRNFEKLNEGGFGESRAYDGNMPSNYEVDDPNMRPRASAPQPG